MVPCICKEIVVFHYIVYILRVQCNLR
jgi:hypothetical protein